jgi:hypothetical protein
MDTQPRDDGPDAEDSPTEPAEVAAPESPVADRGRGPRFRVGLLQKLPKLGFSSWSAREDFKVDEEWAGIVSLSSDAVLGPLEPLAPEHRGG